MNINSKNIPEKGSFKLFVLLIFFLLVSLACSLTDSAVQPIETPTSSVSVANQKNITTIQTAWKASTTEEKKQLCKIILKNVEFDFSRNMISKIVPHSEYRILFQMIPTLQDKLGE